MIWFVLTDVHGYLLSIFLGTISMKENWSSAVVSVLCLSDHTVPCIISVEQLSTDILGMNSDWECKEDAKAGHTQERDWWGGQ